MYMTSFLVFTKLNSKSSPFFKPRLVALIIISKFFISSCKFSHFIIFKLLNLFFKKIHFSLVLLVIDIFLIPLSVVSAILPELVHGFDIAGTSVGYVKQDKIIDGTKISEGDVLIGLKSSGPHSNGYTLIRKLFDGDKELGKKLVEPTRIYVKEVMALINQVDVHGIAHITGGGLDNISRINDNFQYVIDNPLPVPSVFNWLQEKGSVEDKEMYRTFNMGMGMLIIINKDDAKKSISILGEHAQIVGSVNSGTGVKHSAL